ncbi:chromosome segregation and condensation protein, ScpB [Gloeothece citriformis PCC 7424]|uniref:Chromosome segregation and condensation protein, ScpB n=1 Tax=Gloeothece citriformis (strain PCC 7424) TaxID=65393 RepID=B7KHV2_GLOC7|nr:SMC-Scp complex subunit ScpB [Gloeothece citriformis]ACK72049.1 chromosome segregation and condensation protein, ScpB [Gloeothece citriformis PCC 7424]
MQEVRLATKVEAILYLKGQPLSLAEIAEYAHCDLSQVQEAIIELMSDYAHRDSALEVVETPKGYSLQLRTCFEHLMTHLVPAELGTGALRTLAAIALKTPILQTDLINLRGSSAYQQVQELVELGFVRKRRQSEGRSYWLEVTDKFHQYFEIDQLSQLQD